jgi:hypothetical protein
MSCRFFFHVRSGVELIEDPVGEYHPGAEEAHLRARVIARELLAHRQRHASFVVIMDDFGHELDIVPIRDLDTAIVAVVPESQLNKAAAIVA